MNRALLVGINTYPGAPLRGCVNDVMDMAHFLTKSCGFAMNDVRLLTDDRATTTGILDRIGWLLTGLKAGDRVMFHYSGHGAQMATRNPQGEVDGLDEVICPVDFDWSDAHAIRDKQFAQIFSAVPKGVEFVWVSDSCHSGGLTRDMAPPAANGAVSVPRMMPVPADLAWRVQTAREAGIAPMGVQKAAQKANVALISGCKSDQTSADAVFHNRANGALTYYLLQTLGTKDALGEPLSNLVKQVNSALRKARFAQQPQLEGTAALMRKAFLAS
jgi:metacaspase-1